MAGSMVAKSHIHLAQFLCHGPTYHSLALWRHPRTAAAGYDWARPELYQPIARVCERGKFDMVFFADLNYISDTYRKPGIVVLPERAIAEVNKANCVSGWDPQR